MACFQFVKSWDFKVMDEATGKISFHFQNKSEQVQDLAIIVVNLVYFKKQFEKKLSPMNKKASFKQ